MSPAKKQILDLADEFLTDVATAFFDARCQLDAMIEAFEDAVSRLRKKAVRVVENAAVLKAVLIEEAAFHALLERLGADPAAFGAAGPADVPLRIGLPPLWGRRRRYRAVVAEAYRRLAAGVEDYRDGVPEGSAPGDGLAGEPVYYRLVEEMARLINERIAVVNRRACPSELLAYVKQFDPGRVEREGLTGGGSGNGGLDDRLCYLPLDFDALHLPVFPRLAPLARARAAVTDAADAVYRDRPDAVVRLMDLLKKGQASCRPASGPGAMP